MRSQSSMGGFPGRDLPTSRSMDEGELRQAIVDLWKIDQAGFVEEFDEDLAHEMRHQHIEDLEHCTLGQSIAVREFARKAVRLLDVPQELALQAATEAFLRTHRQVTLDLLAEYRERIDGATPATTTTPGTPAAVARANRQIGKRPRRGAR